VKNLEEREVCLSDYRGKLVLVNFWATWCSPCREEMPVLQAYYLDHKDQGFVVVGVNVGDRPQSAAEFVQEAGYNFPIWLDPPGNVVDRLAHAGPSGFAAHRPARPSAQSLDRSGHEGDPGGRDRPSFAGCRVGSNNQSRGTASSVPQYSFGDPEDSYSRGDGGICLSWPVPKVQSGNPRMRVLQTLAIPLGYVIVVMLIDRLDLSKGFNEQ
jgi:thiol-disulfide isomerase/thioredoxin